MTRTAARLAAFAGLFALLAVVGCDPNGSSGSSGSGGTLKSSPPLTLNPAYVNGEDTGAHAGETSTSQTTPPPNTQTTSNTDTGTNQSLEQQKVNSGQDFDGTGTDDNSAPPVPVPASSSAKPKVPLSPSRPGPGSGLDDPKHAPPSPPASSLGAAGQACESVLASHGQKSDCKNPTMALVWGGIKGSLGARFTSWKSIAETALMTGLGYVLTGGLGGVAKLLKIILIGGGALMLLKKIGDLYGAVRDMIKNPNGTKQHADAVWRVANVATGIAVDAGLFTAGGAAGRKLPIKAP